MTSNEQKKTEKLADSILVADSSLVTRNSSLSFIDTHCHLEMSQFAHDREDVIKRAFDSGAEALVTVGSDFKGTAEGVKLSQKYDFIYSSVGIHPHDSKDFNDEILLCLRDWAREKKVVAIGETGLDYHYDHSPREMQRRIFEQHLELAKEADLPVIIHSREAREDTIGILRKSDISRGVLHCFSGDISMAEEAMSMGLYISFAGPLTFSKSLNLQEVARRIPDDYILVETDAPYLSPEPYRGKRNEPSHIVHTISKLAELRGISMQDAARITTLNAKRLFNIGALPEKAEIAYRIRDSIYLNITNRCTNRCSFCVKFHSDYVKGHRLRLAHEPTEEEIKNEIGDPSRFSEVVFCGYGEPLHRLDTVKHISKWVTENGGRVRINTNGHANLIHKRNILPELKGIVHSMSISLDAQDKETYNRICNPAYKDAFDEMLKFIEEAKNIIPDVQVTIVNLEGVDKDACGKIAEKLGVKFRIRELDVVG